MSRAVLGGRSNIRKVLLTEFIPFNVWFASKEDWGGLQIMATNLSYLCLYTPFQGEFTVSFIAITLSLDPGISGMTYLGQQDISKYSASRGWKVLVS